MDIFPSFQYPLRALSLETAGIMLQPIHESTAVAKLTSLPLHGKNKAKRGKMGIATGKAIRPLNSWIAFRSKSKQTSLVSKSDKMKGFYSPIFASLQQKDISGFLTYLWQTEPCKGKWSIIAKAYSLVRDLKGKDSAPLDTFLKINAPYVGIVKPEEYMSVLGYEIEINEFGQIALRKTANPDINNFDNEVLTTNVSVEDVIRNCYELGYLNEGDGANIIIPENEAALTMAAIAQPISAEDISGTYVGRLSGSGNGGSMMLGPGNMKWLNPGVQGGKPSEDPAITRPKSPVRPSDFTLPTEYPFNTEFEPGLDSTFFDPFIGNRFNAFDIGDGYDIKDFDMADWVVDP